MPWIESLWITPKETIHIEKIWKIPADKDKPTFWLFIRMSFFLCRQNINKKIKLVGWHGFTMNCCFSPQVVIPFILSMCNNLLGSTVKRYFHSFLLKCFMAESQCPLPLKTSKSSCQTRSKSLWQNTLNYIFHHSIFNYAIMQIVKFWNRGNKNLGFFLN